MTTVSTWKDRDHGQQERIRCASDPEDHEGKRRKLLRKAYDGGITYFDTARAYSDSEEKIGYALSDVRNHIYLATKTAAKTADEFWKDLETSLRLLKTDCIDVYQFHNPAVCPKPGDESGLYDAALKAREQGKDPFHQYHEPSSRGRKRGGRIPALYATLQFPFCYLCSDADLALMEKCKKADMGFIAMKRCPAALSTTRKRLMHSRHSTTVCPDLGCPEGERTR